MRAKHIHTKYIHYTHTNYLLPPSSVPWIILNAGGILVVETSVKRWQEIVHQVCRSHGKGVGFDL